MTLQKPVPPLQKHPKTINHNQSILKTWTTLLFACCVLKKGGQHGTALFCVGQLEADNPTANPLASNQSNKMPARYEADWIADWMVTEPSCIHIWVLLGRRKSPLVSQSNFGICSYMNPFVAGDVWEEIYNMLTQISCDFSEGNWDMDLEQFSGLVNGKAWSWNLCIKNIYLYTYNPLHVTR